MQNIDGGIPLCVDLDGTLIKTDMLLESIVTLLKTNPFYIFLLPLWLINGRAHLKHQVAKRIIFSPETLPYRDDFVTFLRGQRAAGRRLVLVTASDEKIAARIADHCVLFSEVLASDGEHNLSGKGKLAVLLAKFGEKGFDYAGDSKIDLHIWPHANAAFVVGAGNALVEKARRNSVVSQHFPNKKITPGILARALRLHQWLKNILIFMPLILAHKIDVIPLWSDAFYAFVSFGLCASAIYLLNDLLDLEADRAHPKKKFRPFAAGDLPLIAGVVLIPALLLLSLSIASILPKAFLGILALYFIVTTAYSFYLKQVVLVDVIVLAGLYTLRIIAGAAAVNVPLSEWMLAFSMFLFLSLALLKRFSELRALRLTDQESAQGRGYFANDLEQIASFGAASAYISVLVLALYVNSAEVTHLYSHPVVLLLICPLFLYWLSRIWLLAHRGVMLDDPILFAIKDRASYIVVLLVAGVMFFSL